MIPNPLVVGLAQAAVQHGLGVQMLDQGDGTFISVADLANARVYDEPPQVCVPLILPSGDTEFATVESVDEGDLETEWEPNDLEVVEGGMA